VLDRWGFKKSGTLYARIKGKLSIPEGFLANVCCPGNPIANPVLSSEESKTSTEASIEEGSQSNIYSDDVSDDSAMSNPTSASSFSGCLE